MIPPQKLELFLRCFFFNLAYPKFRIGAYQTSYVERSTYSPMTVVWRLFIYKCFWCLVFFSAPSCCVSKKRTSLTIHGSIASTFFFENSAASRQRKFKDSIIPPTTECPQKFYSFHRKSGPSIFHLSIKSRLWADKRKVVRSALHRCTKERKEIISGWKEIIDDNYELC